jgi:hypothetical protein
MREVGDLEIRALEVQAIGRHELYAVSCARFDHLFAFLGRVCERLSHSTWMHAFAARTVYSRCRVFGSAIYTASISPLPSNSS